ncbi:MAG: KTSC domain-containing protein [Ferrovum sp.]|nr:KTSC domain-containing protein [Ferrovum sp.]
MKTIDMQPVESSQIKAIGYDSAEKVLAVQFTRGGEYRYFDVPQEKFDALMEAESKGAHLGKHIKGTHEFQKVDSETVNGATAA